MYTIINDAFDYKFSVYLLKTGLTQAQYGTDCIQGRIKDWTHPSPLQYTLEIERLFASADNLEKFYIRIDIRIRGCCR